MASVKNLWKPGGLRWHPDADNVNAPEGVVLRADNMVPDRDGSLSLRLGSEKLYTGLGSGTGSVHSIYTAELESGTTYTLSGTDDTVDANGVRIVSDMAGSGDIAIGDDAYQLYMARSTSKKKYQGGEALNWSLAAPDQKPELAAVTAATATVASCDGDESPLCTITEGSPTTVGDQADQDGVASDATLLTPSATTYRAVLQKLWTTDQNFFDISGIDGSETDLVDFYIKIENPRDVKKITAVFGVDASSTVPFKNDRFEFEFNIKDGIEIPLKDLESESYAAYKAAVLGSISSVRPSEITGISTPNQVKETLAAIGKIPSPKSNAPADNVWSHLTVTRGQFKRIGNTAARGWDTVRGFKLVYETLKGKTSTMTVSDIIVIGGGDRALTGTYRCVVRAVRPVYDDAGNIIFYEKSPPSKQSDPVNLNHQALQITLNGTMLNALDSQAQYLWIYLFGGWLDSYYRFAVVPANVESGMTIDEISQPAGSDLDEVLERSRVLSWGFSYCQLSGSGVPTGDTNSDVVVTLRTSELEALTDNTRIEPYQQGVPDKIVDIAGPWNGRMFLLTSEGYVYPTNIDDHTSCNSYQVIDLTRYGDPYWIAKTGNGIYVGMDADIIFLQGDGANSPDLAQINLFGVPLNIGNPPIDDMHWVDGNTITYRSNDGLMVLTGQSLEPVPFAGTSLLWRGQERHDVQMDLTGRFRCAVDNHMLYVQVPESGSSNAIYRFSTIHGQWSRLSFGQVTTWKSIFNNPDGTLLAGDAAGNVWKLETGVQDESNDITALIWTPIEDGGSPMSYKDPMDMQIHMDSRGKDATISILTDGGADETATNYTTASTATVGVWRQQLDDLPAFIKAQIKIAGDFDEFRVHAVNLSYRPRGQRMLRMDAGYLLPREPQDFVWAQEVEFDANCSENFTVKVYREDSLFYTSPTQTANANKRDVYRIPLPRDCKGEHLRFVFESVTDEGEGKIGFDPYRVRVRTRSTGNEDRTRQYQTVWPVGETP